MSEIILIAIGILSVAGIWYVYHKDESDDSLKKTMTILLAIVIVMCTVFMVFDARTRDIALATGESNDLTLALLLGWNNGGYSPYIMDSWGGTDPDDDFDRDGIKNAWDQDADNDGIADVHEPLTRFNPYEPNYGIQKMEIQWLSNTSIIVRCTPVERTTVYVQYATLYLNNIQNEKKTFNNVIEFNLIVDPASYNTIEVKIEGTQSDFANRADDYRSYIIPAAVWGSLGQWYADADLELQGIIRNNPWFQSSSQLSVLDSIFRDSLAGIPLIFWIALIIIIALLLFIRWRRIKKGKPPLLSWGRKKPREYVPGTKIIRFY